MKKRVQVNAWMDVCKPGESSPTEGKWFSQEVVTTNDFGSHCVGRVFGPFDTAEEAESIFRQDAAA